MSATGPRAASATGRTSRPIAPIIVVRVLIPAAALSGALYHLAGGEASLPLWLWKIAGTIGMKSVTAVQLLAALELTVALIVLLSSRLARPTALAALGLLAFSGIAELSAQWGVGAPASDFVSAFVALVSAGVLLAALDRWSPRRLGVPRQPIGVGSSLMALAALTFSLGAAARVQVPDRPKVVPEALRIEPESSILFSDPSRWIGRTLPETRVSTHLPHLTAATLEGRHVVVFYTPRCGECHDLFRAFFSLGSHPDVIAVEVPPPTDAILAETDQPETIECADCIRMTLPAGPAYFIHTPVVVVVENGRITCVEQREPQRCLHPADEQR